jgi:hypothetical protein
MYLIPYLGVSVRQKQAIKDNEIDG